MAPRRKVVATPARSTSTRASSTLVSTPTDSVLVSASKGKGKAIEELDTPAISEIVKGKRKAEAIEADVATDNEADNGSRRTSKRRVVRPEVYVSIPLRRTASKTSTKAVAPVAADPKGKGKGKAKAATPSDEEMGDPSSDEQPLAQSESSLSSLSSEDEYKPAEAPRRSPRKTGKGKQPIVISDLDSDDDGSEYQADFQDDFAADSDDEAVMVERAVKSSMRSLVEERSGASSSGARNLQAEKRARDAERRAERRAERIQDAQIKAELDLSGSDEEGDEDAEPQLDAILVTAAGNARASTWKKIARQEGMRGRKEDPEDRLLRKREENTMKRRLGRRRLTQAERNGIALHMHHPELRDCWGDLEATIEIIKPQKAEQPDGLKLQLLPFQMESLYWMRKQEKSIWNGGMLADEMGMGKTIQTLALLVSDRQKPNLIVAPTVAIMQWRNEIEAHTEGFKVCIWHGASRSSEVQELQKHDVVLTTYAVLESCFRKQQSGFKRKGVIVKEQSPLHAVKWRRIILDEAHNIKERSTNTAKGAFELKGETKWCLSGTPLQNRVGELYSLIRFLGGDPFSFYFCMRCDCRSLHWQFSDKRSCDHCGHSPMNTCFWNNEILSPIQKYGMEGAGKVAFKKLKILLDRMMLRRTKLERADDLGLPPRTVTVRRDYFSAEEKELYLSLFTDAKRQFSTYVGSGTLLNNYSNIFSLITRMRQMACHPDLVLKSKTNKQFSGDIVEATVCRICNDIAEDAIKSKCNHIFDRECIKQYLNTAVEHQPHCPVCHLPLSIDLEAPALEDAAEINNKARQGILGRLDVDTWRSSSKIEALVEELTNLRNEDATTKSIVFSQFVNFLDLINFRLQRAGFVVCRLEGTMSPQARDATIKHFMNNVNVTVFLVSLKAGGVALNLTEASRVYLMDSWWNPAVEYQAMDRIHRLGQHRPVRAIKLVIEDSIESRIVQLQEKKSAMVDATLQRDDSAMGRLTPEDLGFLFRL